MIHYNVSFSISFLFCSKGGEKFKSNWNYNHITSGCLDIWFHFFHLWTGRTGEIPVWTVLRWNLSLRLESISNQSATHLFNIFTANSTTDHRQKLWQYSMYAWNFCTGENHWQHFNLGEERIPFNAVALTLTFVSWFFLEFQIVNTGFSNFMVLRKIKT